MAKSRASRLFLEILAIYVFGLVVLFFYQRHMEYFPDTAPLVSPAEAGVPQMQVIDLKTEDDLDLVAWFAPPKEKDGKIVVFYHGNAGNIAMRSGKAAVFLDRGYGVLLTEYRGFSGNPGSPSEDGLYNDARAALTWLWHKGYGRDQLVIYGESIGCGVAVQMASEIHPKYLILEAGYSSAADVAKDSMHHLIPIDLLMRDKFDSVDKIGAIHTDLLMVHGTDDVVIPIRFGRKLFQAANGPKKFYTVEGAGHNNLYDFKAGNMIADWLDKQVAADKGT